jgi:hypothetical protein
MNIYLWVLSMYKFHILLTVHLELYCTVTNKMQLSIGHDGAELQFRSILAYRQSTFKQIITICHIVHVFKRL